MTNLVGAYAAGINRVLRDRLKFDSDAPYVVHAPIWDKWAWKDFANKYVNVGESLQKNVAVSYFEAGHMMYIHRPSLARMAKELQAFVTRS